MSVNFKIDRICKPLGVKMILSYSFTVLDTPNVVMLLVVNHDYVLTIYLTSWAVGSGTELNCLTVYNIYKLFFYLKKH